MTGQRAAGRRRLSGISTRPIARAKGREDIWRVTAASCRLTPMALMRGDPSLVADAIDVSRRTYRKIEQNLFWAFVYNVVGVPLAAFGVLSPVVAGAAMAFSSVSVVSNALLLRTWKPRASRSAPVTVDIGAAKGKKRGALAIPH
jgi:hypothetical protein